MPSQPPRIAMVGTALGGQGGMSSVVASYFEAGLFQRCGVQYVEAHRSGSAGQRLATAWQGWRQLRGLLNAGGIKLVHIHTASGASFWRKWFYARLALRRGVPLLMHVHGGEFLNFIQGSRPWARRQIEATLRGAQGVIVLSEAWRQRFEAVLPGLPLHVVPNPVFLPAQPAPAMVVARPHFLFLGRLEEKKGLFELLPAFEAVLQRCPEAQITLGGLGNAEDTARVQAWRTQLPAAAQGQVHLPGWVTGATKQALLEQANIFVLPSHVEALPVSMLEAMAYGQAVIVSRVGSVPEVLAHGENGLMVPAQDAPALGQAMVQLALDAEQRVRLGAAARHTIAGHFASPLVVQQLAELYARWA